MIRFSIVIPNLDSGPVLERAIRSVADQNYPDIQLILVDGGSATESMQIIERYRPLFDQVIQEPDDGQADALNKGFRYANGDVFAWLCADDELLPGALWEVAAQFASQPDVGVIAGASQHRYADGTRRTIPVPEDAWEQMTVRNVFNQPSVFWRASLHRRLGELDTSFRLAFDWEFWCRMGAAGARLRIVERPLSRYHFSKTNKTSMGGRIHVEEGQRIIRRYGPFGGRIAPIYRFLYEQFDLKGCMDRRPRASPMRMLAFRLTNLGLRCTIGTKWLDRYNWHFASRQERGLDWWRA